MRLQALRGSALGAVAASVPAANSRCLSGPRLLWYWEVVEEAACSKGSSPVNLVPQDTGDYLRLQSRELQSPLLMCTSESVAYPASPSTAAVVIHLDGLDGS
ncbi:hypothetical protein NDU88_002800 [Pleurodeles waltl]|uniref:Secreted protein n=1 Tax=Pleurodeles waltl TaxID=8319 RepID=A0AAV7SDQ6_PLEWA|nr:hypothetical protein NDU88_002800 [Pleurodeles waltl]